MSVKFTFDKKGFPEALIRLDQILESGDNIPHFAEGGWKSQVWTQISTHLKDETFPCIFAKKAMEERYLLLTFIDGWQETKDLDLLCSHMTQYCDYIKSSHGAGEICPPLMVIFQPQREMDKLYHYSHASWYILQYLHYRDKHAWPDEIPTDPDDPLWSFCFNGCQLFINITSPVLGKHRSRVLSNSLVFTIQPRTNFDIVAGKNTSFGLKVRQKIRERWMKYDGLDSADQLSMYGDEHNREWLQYFLYSDQHPSPSRCPLHIKSK